MTDLSRVEEHPGTDCQGRRCPVHAPSAHHAATWPRRFTEDGYQRICTHQNPHPDPDAHNRTVPAHNCDGCCPPSTLDGVTTPGFTLYAARYQAATRDLSAAQAHLLETHAVDLLRRRDAAGDLTDDLPALLEAGRATVSGHDAATCETALMLSKEMPSDTSLEQLMLTAHLLTREQGPVRLQVVGRGDDRLVRGVDDAGRERG